MDSFDLKRRAHNEVQKSYYEQKDSFSMRPANSRYVNRHLDKFLEQTKIKKEGRILDVGCGRGKYTLLLAERGYPVEGMDLTPGLLDQFRRSDGERFNIPLYQSDITTHDPNLDGQFDAVVGFFVLHHLFNITKSFTAIAALAKPGAQVIFLEPNAYNPLYYLQMLLIPGMTWKGDKGVFKMRKNLIFKAMKDAGLTNLEIHRFGFFPPFITNTYFGEQLEGVFEKFPLWQQILPFQIFIGQKPE